MSGFHTATICDICHPPVVAISTGHGSRCPRCDQVEEWSPFVINALDTNLDEDLACQILTSVAIRSDGDARLLCELARRLLNRAGESTGDEGNKEVDLGATPEAVTGGTCPHCQAKEPSVWDSELFHYAHPAESAGKLKMCHSPWRARCLRCSANVTESKVKFCEQCANPLTEA
jgi:hypothetical protein